MENSAQATPSKEYDLNSNTDGSIDISFSHQIMDPAMMTLFIFPILFFTSCSGILAVDNTFGIPGDLRLRLYSSPSARLRDITASDMPTAENRW
jgi:hypothetical protein